LFESCSLPRLYCPPPFPGSVFLPLFFTQGAGVVFSFIREIDGGMSLSPPPFPFTPELFQLVLVTGSPHFFLCLGFYLSLGLAAQVGFVKRLWDSPYFSLYRSMVCSLNFLEPLQSSSCSQAAFARLVFSRLWYPIFCIRPNGSSFTFSDPFFFRKCLPQSSSPFSLSAFFLA